MFFSGSAIVSLVEVISFFSSIWASVPIMENRKGQINIRKEWILYEWDTYGTDLQLGHSKAYMYNIEMAYNSSNHNV
jgi:hypothetical protein